MINLTDFLALAPEITLLLMVSITLLIRLFSTEKNMMPVYYSSQLSCVFTLAAILYLYITKSFGSSFSGMWEVDEFSLAIKMVISTGMMFIFCYGKDYLKQLDHGRGDYYLLALLALLGMLVLPSATNLLMLFMGIEIMSLPIYAMVALWRNESSCVEAALKYFITGAVASCLLLYGFSLLYGATGLLNFADIKIFLDFNPTTPSLLLPLAVTFICAGFAFKLGAVPFHNWAPDVYEGAPLPVTLLIATLPKIAIFSVVLRLFAFALAGVSSLWSGIFFLIALLSIIVGNIVAMAQQNIRRMLAYSSIAHMGYLLLGLGLANDSGYSAALFYILIYVIANLAIFGLLLSVNHKHKFIASISDMTGIYHTYPMFAFLLLLVMFSLAGVPPIVGFMAKLAIFSALVKVNLTFIAVIAILFTLLGAFYYIRVLKTAYFEKGSDHFKMIFSGYTSAVLFINTLALLLLGMFPGFVFSLCNYLVLPF